jgi:hypothetical protein
MNRRRAVRRGGDAIPSNRAKSSPISVPDPAIVRKAGISAQRFEIVLVEDGFKR